MYLIELFLFHMIKHTTAAFIFQSFRAISFFIAKFPFGKEHDEFLPGAAEAASVSLQLWVRDSTPRVVEPIRAEPCATFACHIHPLGDLRMQWRKPPVGWLYFLSRATRVRDQKEPSACVVE